MPIVRHALGAQLGDTERIFTAVADAARGAAGGSVHENVVRAGAVVPLHRHAVEEIIVCLAGEAECSFDGGEPQRYEAGSVVVIPANVPHTIRNVGAGELRQLAFFPALTPQTQWIEPAGSVSH